MERIKVNASIVVTVGDYTKDRTANQEELDMGILWLEQQLNLLHPFTIGRLKFYPKFHFLSSEKREEINNHFKEICKNCGLTYGSHHGGTSPYPRDYCPGHEGRMDWEDGPGTTFKPTGKYKEE